MGGELKKRGGQMTVTEAGRMGGRLVSERYGPEFYEKIGKKGGSSTASKYGPEFFGKIGKKGGRMVSQKYGPGHFEKIGRKGGQKVADLIERAKALEAGVEERESMEALPEAEVHVGPSPRAGNGVPTGP